MQSTVGDHYHLRGKYRGAARKVCKTIAEQSIFSPVVFHDLKNCDFPFLQKCIRNEIKIVQIDDISKTESFISKKYVFFAIKFGFSSNNT